MGDGFFTHPLAQRVLELGLLDEQIVLDVGLAPLLRSLQIEAEPLLHAAFAGASRQVHEQCQVEHDGAASNNDLDMLGEAKTAALLAKGVSQNATSIPAHQALRMATYNGAKALGLEASIGSLEPNKSADMIAIDLSHLIDQPIYDPISHLIYNGCGQKVSHVWVKGKMLVDQGELISIDIKTLQFKVSQWRDKIRIAENQQSMSF